MKNIIKKIKENCLTIIKRSFPRWTANRLYRIQFSRSINWNSPTEFNEKLRWLQFNTDTSKWTLFADKYKVREYLTDNGYEDMLVKLYGVWEKAEDIDFTILPNSFVLKTNHGSGDVFIIKDKQTENLDNLRKELNKALQEPFGIKTAEPHYLKIKPIILAEELLTQDGDFSSSLADYKFYCIYGEPIFCGVMYNRDVANHTYDVNLYDSEWKNVNELLRMHTVQNAPTLSQPKNFEKMKAFCHDVCAEFPFVRMDFYECNGKLYFGEFTFTPAACTGGTLGTEACNILANKLQIPPRKYSIRANIRTQR